MFGYYVGVLKSLTLAGRPVLGDLPVHLKLSSNSNHITCMIINYSLHSYIRICLLHLETFFYSLLLFQWLLAIAPSPSRLVLPSINTESSGWGSPHPHTLLFSLPLTLFALPLAKTFTTKLKCKETLQKFPKLITTKPSSSVVWLVLTNITLFLSLCCCLFYYGQVR